MVQIEVLAFEAATAVLASVAVALENVVPGKLYLFLRHPVEDHQKNDPGNANLKRDGMDNITLGVVFGKIPPLGKAIGLK